MVQWESMQLIKTFNYNNIFYKFNYYSIIDSYIHLLFDTLEDAAALNLSNSDLSVSISLEL